MVRKIAGSATVLLACAGMALASPGAPRESDYGKYQYESKCATCHGLDGKGDGPLKKALRREPTDLTILSKANGGVFPTSRVTRVIDGRLAVGAHGTRAMPVWGRDFLDEVPPGTQAPYQTEVAVQARISALIDYLNTLQVK